MEAEQPMKKTESVPIYVLKSPLGAPLFQRGEWGDFCRCHA